jgi:hypothetical protein
MSKELCVKLVIYKYYVIFILINIVSTSHNLGTENVAKETTTHKHFFRETNNLAATERRIQAFTEVYSRNSLLIGLLDS